MAAPSGFLFTLPAALFEGTALPGSGGDAAAGAGASSGGASTSEAQQQPDQPAAAAAGGERPPTPPRQQQAQQHAESAWSEAGATCIACGIGVSGPGFASAAEQRQHFKTDWHRYNVKRRVARKPPVGEEQFDAIVGDDACEVSSISGSDTADSFSSSEDEDDDGGGGGGGGGGAEVGAARPPSRPRRARDGGAAGKVPQFLFETAAGARLAVWRCLLYADHTRARPSDESLLSELRRVRSAPASWALLLARGGHFAAAVFRMRPAPPGKGQHAGEAFEVVAHKTFHRYVVRAKAGGKQSSKDASGKYAKSAGSALRRYNEVALSRDVAELMTEWRPMLEGADIIFVHTPSSNAKLVFGAAGAAGERAAPGERWALDPADPRVRRVPFVTRRPTFSELRRVLLLLGAVMQPRAEEAAAEEGEEQQGQGAEAGSGAAGEEARQQAAGGGGGGARPGQAAADAAAAAVLAEAAAAASVARKKEELPPLIKAAKAGDAERVQRLLEGGAHDPAATDALGRTAYQLATTKEVRDTLRRGMAAAPDKWDWAAAKVPSPLTDELESAQASKKAEKRAKLKAKERERKDVAPEKKAEAAAAAAAAIEDEIARAAAEAAALSVRASGGRGGGAAAGRQVNAPAAARRSGGGGGGGSGGIGGRGAALLLAAAFLGVAVLSRRQQRQAPPRGG